MPDDPYALTSADKDLVSAGKKLRDTHVDKFHQLIQNCTSIIPRTTLYCNRTELIKPIERGTQHVQIIHCCTDRCNKCQLGHWIVFYYDGESCFIYDSLNQKSLYKNAENFIRALCPFWDHVSVYYPQVQYQTNEVDCGPHAMAMATSVVFNEDPSSVEYRIEDLRKHILIMCEKSILMPFPKLKTGIVRNLSIICPRPKLIWNKLPRHLWTHPPRGIFCQSTGRDIRYYVRGLPNPDSVSCYANATLQSLLHCESVRELFSRRNESNVFSLTMQDYRSGSSVDIKELRAFAGANFRAKRQQDVAEFLLSLLNESSNLRSLFEHTLVTSRRCVSCGNETSSAPMTNYILPAVLPPNYKRSSLQSIIDFNVGSWNKTELRCGIQLPIEKRSSSNCDEKGCCLGLRSEKVTLESENREIIIQLQFYREDSAGNVAKITDISLLNISENVVNINSDSYRVESIILHQGSTINQGHYTNILRGINSWIRVNDDHLHQTTQFRSPHGNPYIIILRKVGVVDDRSTPNVMGFLQDSQDSRSKKNLPAQNRVEKTIYPIENRENSTVINTKILMPVNLTARQSDLPQPRPRILIRNSTVGTFPDVGIRGIHNPTSTLKSHLRNDGFISISPIERRHDYECVSPRAHTILKNVPEGTTSADQQKYTVVRDTQRNLETFKVLPIVTEMENSYNQRKYSLQNFLFPNKTVERTVESTSARIKNTDMTEKVSRNNTINHFIDLSNHSPHGTKRKFPSHRVHEPGHDHPAKIPRAILRQGPGIVGKDCHASTPIHPEIISPISLLISTSGSPTHVEKCHDAGKKTKKSQVQVVNGGLMNCSVHKSFSDVNMVLEQYEAKQLNESLPMKVSHTLNNIILDSKSMGNSDFVVKRRLYQRNFYSKNRERVLEKKRITYQRKKEEKLSQSQGLHLSEDLHSYRTVFSRDTPMTNETPGSVEMESPVVIRQIIDVAKIRAAHKIILKYRNMRRYMMTREPHVVEQTSVQQSMKKISVDHKKTTDDLLKSKGKYIQRVLENLDSPSSVEGMIEADSLVTRCIHVRNSVVLRVKRCLTKLSKKCEIAVSKLGEVSITDNVQFSVSVLCGKPLHHSTSGPYFLETAYNPDILRQTKEQNTDHQVKSSRKPLVMDDSGKVTNVLPVWVKPGKSSSTWVCDEYCRSVDVDILKELKYLFDDFVVQKYTDARDFFRHIDECSSKARHPNKRGHPISCFTEPLSCKSRFLKLNILSYHFPFLRTMKRIIYEISHLY
ncbi:hypothetical protein QAD02_017955 [Eretmocerus hayati]|uniref:Uncharacterized protein n=1 Tax=Eretmocerus hayati TaxID=131215 RepID=A0ACC2PFD8_9HYME|nr:hypothetical protein QAD02_017955 [Eretmocerus hayati]